MRYNTEKAGEISQLCCPPYDIISEEQRLGYISENEYNIIRLELPKEGENPYQTAREILDMWRDKGTTNVRSKHGIYRNVGKNPFGSNALLKDEELYLTDFKIYEKKSNDNPQAVDD